METAALLALLLLPLPPPEEPEADVPDERVVPLVDVFALDEMLVFVLLLDSTVVLALAVEEDESAELELTLDMPGAALRLEEASADVDDTGAETALVEDGVSSALPGDADAPEPAPEDEPAVLPEVELDVVEEELLNADWM